MTPHKEASRRAYRLLGLLTLLGLIPVAGLGMALSGAASSEVPRAMVNACLAMMEAAWQVTQRHLTVHPLTTAVVLLLGGSLIWATLRMLASVANTRRLLATSETYTPGRQPTLDTALAHRELSSLALRVLISPHPLAFTVGLLRPQIVLSYGMISSLTQEELRAALFHELSHVRSRDPLRLAVARFLADALWFLPVARSLTQDFVDVVEEGADDWAVGATRQPVDLASALVKTAKAGMAWSIPLASSLAGNLSVQERVERLLGMRMGRQSAATIGRWLVSGLITLLLLVLVMLPFDGREAAAQRAMAAAMRGMPTMTCPVSPR